MAGMVGDGDFSATLVGAPDPCLSLVLVDVDGRLGRPRTLAW